MNALEILKTIEQKLLGINRTLEDANKRIDEAKKEYSIPQANEPEEPELKPDWHILDLSESQRTRLLEWMKMSIGWHFGRHGIAPVWVRLKDILVIGSRAYPLEYKHLIRPDSDLDILVIVTFTDFYPYPAPHEMSYTTKSRMEFDGIRISVRITDRYPQNLPYYSLVKQEFYIPEDLSKFKEVIERKQKGRG